MRLNPYLEILIATVFWGFNGIIAKTIGLPPTSTAAFRMAVPAILLLGYLFYKRINPFTKGSKLMYGASSLNALRMVMYYYAFTLTYVSLGVVMLYTWPIFASILAAIFLKEKISKKWPFFITGFAGVILIYAQKTVILTGQDYLGLSVMLISAFIYSITVILYKKESGKYSPFELTFYQNFIGAIIFIPFLFLNRPLPILSQVGMGLELGIGVGIIGFLLFFSALKKIPTHKASTMAYMEVVMTVLFSVLLLGEIITWNLIIGGLLIVGSAYIVSRKN